MPKSEFDAAVENLEQHIADGMRLTGDQYFHMALAIEHAVKQVITTSTAMARTPPQANANASASQQTEQP